MTGLLQLYKTLGIQINKALSHYMWDTTGKKYIDMVAAYSSVNQGHLHPDIVKTAKLQLNKITITGRYVDSPSLNQWSNLITSLTNKKYVIPMNTGSEAVETSIKYARIKAYTKYNIENGNIISLKGNFHGRTMTAIAMSNINLYRNGFGKFIPNIITDDLFLNSVNENTCAIIYEPIQGEGGINKIPDITYKRIYELKLKYPHISVISDQIQCGLGRAGPSLVIPEPIIPDAILLAKSLGGGIVPISCVLADDLDVFTYGTHGSTFGGNPYACEVSKTAIMVLCNMINDTVNLSKYFIDSLLKIKREFPYYIEEIRGQGLFLGIKFNKCINLYDLQIELLKEEFITSTARENVLRITPPFTINKTDIDTFIMKIYKILNKHKIFTEYI